MKLEYITRKGSNGAGRGKETEEKEEGWKLFWKNVCKFYKHEEHYELEK